MRTELENKLFKKYPKLFAQKDLKASQTSMCFGVETPDSWFPILDTLCFCIQKYINDNPLKIEQIEFIQVKEKFGSLRAYTNYSDDLVDELILMAELMTTKICSVCGSTDDVDVGSDFYVSYECKKCRRKFRERE